MKKRALVRGLGFGALAAALVGPAFLSSFAWAQPRGGAAAAPAATQASAEAEDINLAIGETRTISAKDIRNYSEGVPNVIDVKLTSDASQFVITGKKPGSTTLLLIRADGTQTAYNINVFSRSPQVVEKELMQLLDGIPAVRVRRIGARLFIEGSVSNEGEVQRMKQIAALYPGQVESLVSIGNSVGADRKMLIRIDFYFTQFDRSSSYGVGIGMPSSIGGDNIFQNAAQFDFVSGTLTSATASISNQPLPRLDIASRRGWAKVLKQATIVTANGAEAVFQNGGEQNFVANTGLTVGLTKVRFGTEVTVLPRFDSTKREFDIKIEADISDLTAAINSTIPGRNTSKLTTNVCLKLGQSIILSGIRSKSQTHSVGGLPLLSEIPVLGLFFGSHSNTENDIEGAIFIVPSVIETPPRSAQEMVDGALSRYREYHGEVETVNAYDKEPPSVNANKK